MLLVPDVAQEIEFKVKFGMMPTVLIVGYAPYYTTVDVQHFHLMPSFAGFAPKPKQDL